MFNAALFLFPVYSNPKLSFSQKKKKKISVEHGSRNDISQGFSLSLSFMWYIYYGNEDLEVVIANIMGGEAYVDQDCSRTWAEDLIRIEGISR